MEESIWGKLKNYVRNHIAVLFLILIVIILVLLFLPVNNPENNKQMTPTLSLTLKGNKEVSILRGETYQEKGYTAYDSKEGDITSRVVVTSNVDTNIVGTYTITYRITNSSGITKEETRNIIVAADLSDLKIDIDYAPKELTNGNVVITLKTSGDGYDFTLDPDGNIIRLNEIKYEVSSNDEYIFSIKRKDGNVFEKSVEIKNIDKKKPTGSCKNVINDDKTVITVTANDENGIKNYSYNFNNQKYDSESNTYTVKEMVRNVAVTVYDKADNYSIINCLTVDNSWPIFEHQNYKETTPKHYNQEMHYNYLNYILYYPDSLDLNEKNPLVIFLHGSGEFSSNINRSFNNNTTFVNNMKSGRFGQKAIFLAPQCASANKKWVADCFDDLKGLIDQIVVKYNVDPKRISITGHSLGGGAVIDAISRYPDFFSAAVPLAPANDHANYSNIKNIKVVIIVGTNDGLYATGKNIYNRMKQHGVNIKFYEVPNVDHAIQPSAFNETNVIEWMIAQSR